MAKENTLYKCEICGNVVEVVNAGAGELVCCGEPMNELKPKSIEQEGKEKHVPIVNIEGNNVNIKLGNVPHPMTEDHYIELIQIIKDNKISKEKRLYPNDNPEANFLLDDTTGIKARAFCNLHGLWISE